ncbi:HmuY family protein [Cupriavidus basilensis]
MFSGTNDIASAAFEYGVGGANDHLLYPNFRTFLITTDSTRPDPVGSASSPVYALQVTGYYGGAGGTTSGNPSFRWVDRSDASQTVRTAQVNAAGDWVYYDLQAGAVTTAAGNWHIAFNRYNFKLNGGEVGQRQGRRLRGQDTRRLLRCRQQAGAVEVHGFVEPGCHGGRPDRHARCARYRERVDQGRHVVAAESDADRRLPEPAELRLVHVLPDRHRRSVRRAAARRPSDQGQR